MSELPVPAEIIFRDFAFDLTPFKIERDSETIGTAKGLKNSENGKDYVSFLFGTDVQKGDILKSEEETFYVTKTLTDTYSGEKQLINAFYIEQD